MPIAVRPLKIPTLFLAASLLTLALILSAAPVQAAPGQGEVKSPQTQSSARQRALTYDHRTAPRNASLLGRFNAADHRPAARTTGRQPAPAPTLFFDLEREVEVEVDVWYGKAGMQFNW